MFGLFDNYIISVHTIDIPAQIFIWAVFTYLFINHSLRKAKDVTDECFRRTYIRVYNVGGVLTIT